MKCNQRSDINVPLHLGRVEFQPFFPVCLFSGREQIFFFGGEILSKFEKDSQMALMSTLRGRKVTVLVCVPHRFITQPPSPNVNQLDGFIFIRMNEKCFMKRKIFSVETGGEFWGHFLPVINDRRRLKRWPGENTCRLKWTAASPCRCVAEIFCQLFARPVKNEQRRRALHTPR